MQAALVVCRRDDRDMAKAGAHHADKHRRSDGERERHRDHDHHRGRDVHSNGQSRIRGEWHSSPLKQDIDTWAVLLQSHINLMPWAKDKACIPSLVCCGQ